MSDRIIIREGDVDTAVIADYEATRRDALRRGVVLGGGVVAAAGVPALLKARNAFAQAEGDAAILESAVALEQTAVVAYETAAKSGLLDPPLEKVAKRFQRQEQEHADGLTTALEGLGGEVRPKPKPEEIEGLGDVKSQQDVLRFAIELENMAVAAYYDAQAKLEDPKLLETTAQIMGNEGQHLVVLRKAAGEKELVPEAFEKGRQVG